MLLVCGKRKKESLFMANWVLCGLVQHSFQSKVNVLETLSGLNQLIEARAKIHIVVIFAEEPALI